MNSIRRLELNFITSLCYRHAVSDPKVGTALTFSLSFEKKTLIIRTTEL